MLSHVQRDHIQRAASAGWGAGVVSGSHLTYCRQARAETKPSAVRDRTRAAEGTLVVSQVTRLAPDTPSTSVPPFRHDASMLALDGSIPAFARVRHDLLGALPPDRHADLDGASAGEHLHQLLLERHRQVPDRPLHGTIRATILNVQRWCDAARPGTPLSLRLIWAHAPTLAGVCLNRPLWTLERDAPLRCPHCTRPHAYPSSRPPYRAVVVASEPLTDEDWQRLPDASLFTVDADGRLQVQPVTARRTAWFYSTSR